MGWTDLGEGQEVLSSVLDDWVDGALWKRRSTNDAQVRDQSQGQTQAQDKNLKSRAHVRGSEQGVLWSGNWCASGAQCLGQRKPRRVSSVEEGGLEPREKVGECGEGPQGLRAGGEAPLLCVHRTEGREGGDPARNAAWVTPANRGTPFSRPPEMSSARKEPITSHAKLLKSCIWVFQRGAVSVPNPPHPRQHFRAHPPQRLQIPKPLRSMQATEP